MYLPAGIKPVGFLPVSYLPSGEGGEPPVEAPFVYLTGGRLASDPTGERAAQTLTGARLK
jgi:hypothetical protein